MLRLFWYFLFFILVLECTSKTTTTTTTHAPTTHAPTTRAPTVYKPTTKTPTLTPTKPTRMPTHGPTKDPTHLPTMSPTISLGANEDIKVVVNVTLQGSQVANLCQNLNNYEKSLLDVFIAASGVSSSEIESTEIVECDTVTGGSALTYSLRSKDSRVKNIVPQRIKDLIFIETYESNLQLLFSSATVTSVYLVSDGEVPSESTKSNPFNHFFSGYFGLGVVIVAVSALWCFMLRVEKDIDGRGDVEELRLKQLQEEKRAFELKYGAIEEDSMDQTDKEMSEELEMGNAAREVQPAIHETNTVVQPVQTQTNGEKDKKNDSDKKKDTETKNEKETQNTTSEHPYRASVVAEVKHVTNPEERESLDLDQIKDPGKKRRKTQEYLNNLWDDKSDQKDPKTQQDQSPEQTQGQIEDEEEDTNGGTDEEDGED